MEETMSLELYFAYGSNLDLEQMRRRCPGSRMISTGRLSGYELAFVGHSASRGGGVATVMPASSGARVAGVLYEMTLPDWCSLDRFEGTPDIYRREQVRVINPVGWAMEAVTYIRNEGHHRPPSPHYRRIVAGGYRTHGLPAEQLEAALAASQPRRGLFRG